MNFLKLINLNFSVAPLLLNKLVEIHRLDGASDNKGALLLGNLQLIMGVKLDFRVH